jgi:hypothetical protein
MDAMTTRPFLVFALLAPELAAGESTVLEVRETAGIRRFGYPVSAMLELDRPPAPGTRFRLLAEGKLVTAQFRSIDSPGKPGGMVSLDFEANLLPFETRRYKVEYGNDVEAGPEPERGLAIEETGNVYRISSGSQLAWEVARDLTGLLRSARAGGMEYLEPGSEGLFLRLKGGERRRLGSSSPGGASGPAGRIVKRGPIDCLLRFDGEEDLTGSGKVSWAVELEFPRAKSWVRVGLSVNDPQGLVEALDADLRLHLEGGRAFADFGAGTLVYAVLERGQRAVFRTGLPGEPSWEVLRGEGERLEPYVASGPGARDRVEGWAHVMDRERCTAVAVGEFGRKTEDRIEVDAAGRLELGRDFTKRTGASPAPASKSLVFWLHFVSMPPHVGAVTSPQSMMSPLEATWRR